jgi:hypothetical protein
MENPSELKRAYNKLIEEITLKQLLRVTRESLKIKA